MVSSERKRLVCLARRQYSATLRRGQNLVTLATQTGQELALWNRKRGTVTSFCRQIPTRCEKRSRAILLQNHLETRYEGPHSEPGNCRESPMPDQHHGFPCGFCRRKWTDFERTRALPRIPLRFCGQIRRREGDDRAEPCRILPVLPASLAAHQENNRALRSPTGA